MPDWSFPTGSEKYQSPGFCIYCGVGDPLSDEHIIPFSLGGNIILQKSSCNRCATITSLAERTVAQHMFGDVRATHRFPSRRKKWPDVITWRNPETEEEIEIGRDNFPAALGFPRLLRPGKLVGRPPISGKMKIEGFTSYLTNMNDTNNRMGYTTTWFKLEHFFELLAKIAHSYFIADKGAAYASLFYPYLPYFIAREDRNYNYLIGESDVEILAHKGVMHQLRSVIISRLGIDYAVVQMQLFAFAGTPVYEVVFGTRPSSGNELSRWPPFPESHFR